MINKAIEKTEEKKISLASKDPIEQLKDFELFAKSYDLQNTGSSSEVATTTCPVHYTSGIRDENGDSPLIKAIKNKDDATVAYYIKTCTDIKVTSKWGIHTPLHLSSDSADITNALIAAGADVNAKDGSGKTPLHWSNSVETANALIAAGADVNAKDNLGSTPLHWSNSAEIANSLIAAGADVNARSELDLNMVPLHRAKSAKIVNVLMAAGADVNAIDIRGIIPLRWAKSVEIVNAFIAAGADIHSKDFYGVPVLEEICSSFEHPLCHNEGTLTIDSTN